MKNKTDPGGPVAVSETRLFRHGGLVDASVVVTIPRADQALPDNERQVVATIVSGTSNQITELAELIQFVAEHPDKAGQILEFIKS